MLHAHQQYCVIFQAPLLKNELTGIERAAGIDTDRLVHGAELLAWVRK